MKSRKKYGGTLALVVVLLLVVVIIGIGFVVWQLLLGGGKELQLGTDSGNLNVAKQVLKNPSVTFTDQNINGVTISASEFDGLLDPGNRVNLLNFNRLVAKAVLAQLNAQQTMNATPTAKANAKILTQAVYRVGNMLRDQIDNAGNLEASFTDLAGKANTRMLQTGGAGKLGAKGNAAAVSAIRTNQSEHEVSFMARRAASNVFIDTSSLDAGQLSLLNGNLVPKDVPGFGNQQFLAGYQSITTANGLQNSCPATYAVPMRPGEQPHLVSQDDFKTNEGIPLPNTEGGQVLPNAFRSGGSAQSFHVSGNTNEARSCAIIGVLAQVFRAAQTGGTIIVDNTSCNGAIAAQSFQQANPIQLPSPIMAPDGIEIYDFTLSGDSGTWPGGTPGLRNSKTCRFLCSISAAGGLPSAKISQTSVSTQFDSFQGSPVYDESAAFPAGPINDLQFWALHQDNKVRYTSQFIARTNLMNTGGSAQGTAFPGTIVGRVSHVATCNNLNGPGSDNPDPTCSQPDIHSAVAAYAGGGQTAGIIVNLPAGAMLLEEFILRAGGGDAGDGCAFAPTLRAPNTCGNGNDYTGSSGLKHVIDARPPFPEDQTLNILFQITGTTSDVQNDIRRRLHQINPEGSDGTINNIFNQNVPFGPSGLLYIHKVGNNLVMDQSKPASLNFNYDTQSPCQRPVINTANGSIPDGNRIDSPGVIIRASGHFGGLGPPQWECGGGERSGQSNSKSFWFPSSGIRGLLGVIRFANCPESNGPDWCCP